MTWRVYPIAVILGSVVCGTISSLAQDPSDPLGNAGRAQRRDYLKARAAEFELFRAEDREKPYVLTKEPVLRFSNVARGFLLSDGEPFLWLDGERPVAVAAWAIRQSPSRVYREFTSLSSEPLTCLSDGREVWTPTSGSVVNRALPMGAAPADNASRRLAQMRTIAGRFSSVVHREGAPTELRLVPQPFYRYRQQTPEVLDGALFSFAEGTDPEALLMLEARQGENKGEFEWRYTLARMTSLPVVIRLDDKEIWSVENFYKSSRSPNDPYVEATAGRYTPPEVRNEK